MFQPDGDVDLHCGANCVCYAVWIDMSVMADVLEHRLGHAVHRPLELAATLDLSTPAGRTWAGLIRLLVSWPVLRHPLLADPVRETVADRLLLASTGPYLEELDAPTTGGAGARWSAWSTPLRRSRGYRLPSPTCDR